MPPESLTRRYRRFWGADPARDVNEELAFHLEMRVEELRRAGMTEAEARDETMQRFGNPRRVRDECEELSEERVQMKRRADQAGRVTSGSSLRAAHFRGEPRLYVHCRADDGHRHRRKYRGLQRCLWRPPATVAVPRRRCAGQALVEECRVAGSSSSPSRRPTSRIGATAKAFASMAAFERQRDATLVRQSTPSTPESIEAAAVMPEIFSLLGAAALRGRALLTDDALPGAARVAVVSYDLWNARFGTDSTPHR